MEHADEVQRTLNPTVTGTSVFAVKYTGGVVIASDRLAAYGKTARYKNVSRQYQVNERVVISFGGDHADFQWLQNIIERQTLVWESVGQKITPSALHSYLTSLLYSKRCKMNPLWNTLVVVGTEEKAEEKFVPFIGVITQRGVAYTTDSVATGMGAMLLNQLIEDERKKKYLNKDEAIAIVKKAIELAIYHDCVADNDFEISYIDKGFTTLGKSETVIGDWSIAETNCQYE